MAVARVVLIALLHALLWETTLTYPSGAPTARCESMTPGHGTESTAANPYSLDIGSVTMYRPGAPIQVTVKGANFRGLLLQVRRVNEQTYEPIGRFNSPPAVSALRLVNCNNVAGGAITHASANEKFESVLTWQPPSSDVGEIEFVATVNQEQLVWWKNVKSSSLTFDPTTSSTTTPFPTTSTSPNSLPTGSTTPPPSSAPPSSSTTPDPNATTVGGASITYAVGYASMVLCGALWLLLKV